MNVVNVDSYKELIKNPIPIGFGDTAICFMGHDGNVIKLFHKEYRENNIVGNYEFIHNLNEISKISNDVFIGPKTLIFCNNSLHGYIYEYISGKDLNKVSPYIHIKDLFYDFDRVENAIMEISKKKFIARDVHGGNIIYKDNKYYFIDLDKGEFCNRKSADEIYNYNLCSYINAIFNKVYALKRWHVAEFSNEKIKEFLSRNSYNRQLINEMLIHYEELCDDLNPSLVKVRKKTLKDKSIDISELFS